MRCVHCLKKVDKKDRDHVFPKSWYSDTTPSNVQRWIVPSCVPCNRKYGRIEEELRNFIVACIGPTDPLVSGLYEKMLRSFGIGIRADELSEEERTLRYRKLQSFLNRLEPHNQSHRVFPGFGLHHGFTPEQHHVMPAPVNDMRIVAGKIFRGAEYILGARYLEPPLVLKISHVDQEPREVRLILPHAAISHLGPGFELKRFSTRSLGVGRDIVIYKAVILNKWTVYGIIEKSWLQYIAARFICW